MLVMPRSSWCLRNILPTPDPNPLGAHGILLWPKALQSAHQVIQVRAQTRSTHGTILWIRANKVPLVREVCDWACVRRWICVCARVHSTHYSLWPHGPAKRMWSDSCAFACVTARHRIAQQDLQHTGVAQAQSRAYLMRAVTPKCVTPSLLCVLSKLPRRSESYAETRSSIVGLQHTGEAQGLSVHC